MITLAVASAVAVLVSQLSGLTGGEDGLNYSIPRELTPAFKLGEPFRRQHHRQASELLPGVLCLAGAVPAVARIVNSPFGRVLQAIRENDFRAEAIGYRVVFYRTLATCLSAAIAAIAGSLFAIWLRYVGPDTTLSFEIMLDILLMVVIGGMGTMYGAVIGATIFVLAQNYLQNLMGVASGATEGLPLIPHLLDPDRWLLWLGVLFILSVYFFPTGIVGRLRSED
jgi:branched-chain amino acid transport system permease protein